MAKKSKKTTKKTSRKTEKQTEKKAKPKKTIKKIKEEKKEGKSPEEKQQVIKKFALKKGDTGSPEVQVALLSHKINRLTEHLDQNPKDNHSRRGLLKVIAKRRRILNYLEKKDEKRYKTLIKKVELKK